MARRNFATVDALLILACIVIFAGGALAQSEAFFTSAPLPTNAAGDRP
jgi:hypothetical protein